MPPTIGLLTLALAGLTTVDHAALTSPDMPSFRDIEYRYGGDDALTAGREAIRQAIPHGMPLAVARDMLVRAGARCKAVHHDPQTIRCIYNELTIVDEAVDDIRWKTMLTIVDDRIQNVSVDREVDRHGPQD